MRGYKSAYIGTVFFVGLGSVIATLAHPDNELLLMAMSHWLLAVLTFPLGFIASAIAFVVLHAGIATPAEATVVATPVFAVLGYIQWYRLLPAFYRTGK